MEIPNTNTPPNPLAQTPVAQAQVQLPQDVVDEINKKAQRFGLRYSKLEQEYITYISRPDLAKKNLIDQKRLGLLMIEAECTRYADNPLIDYEVVVWGTTMNDNWKTSKVICGTMIPGKDTPDVFNNNGSLGIPTIISNFKEKYQIVKTMSPFAFYRANLTSSGIGVQRREITSTVDTTFEPISHPEISRDHMMAWLEKAYPIQTLSALIANPSKLVQPKKAGGNPFVDDLDFKRVQVAIKNTTSAKRKDNTAFYQYTVVDDSLTEDQKLNVKDATGKTILYGGMPMNVPEHIYTALNLDVNSIVDALVTARKVTVKPGTESTSKTGVALSAIAIFPIVEIKKKVPDVQTPTGQVGGQVQAVDLTTMG